MENKKPLMIGICKKCGRIMTMGNVICPICGTKFVETNYTADEFSKMTRFNRKADEELCEILRKRYVLNPNNTEYDEEMYYKREDKEIKQKMMLQQQFKEFEEKCEREEAKYHQSTQTVCPKCGSTSFTPVRRKWSFLTGFMTNKVDMVCNNCGCTVKKG